MIQKTLTEEIVRIAEEAGEIVLSSFRTDHEFVIKSDEPQANDFATQADLASQKFILSELKKLRPHDIYIAEEDEKTTDSSPLTTDPDSLTWYIDPIDGTINYSRGVEFFGISIGAVNTLTGEAVYGVVRAPGINRTWFAHEGKSYVGPNFKNAVEFKNKIHKTAHLLGIAFGYEKSEQRLLLSKLPALMEHFGDIRLFGSGALNICFLAEGRLDAYMEITLHPWDHKAGALIANNVGILTRITPNLRTGAESITAAKTKEDFDILVNTLEEINSEK